MARGRSRVLVERRKYLERASNFPELPFGPGDS
jgi:hypothetical protein